MGDEELGRAKEEKATLKNEWKNMYKTMEPLHKKYQDTKQQEIQQLKTESKSKYKVQNLPNELKPCGIILKSILNESYADYFDQPVDINKHPTYLQYVSRPMCLSIVEKNLYNGIYKDINEFGKDMRQIWTNSLAFNSDPGFQNLTIHLKQKFESLFLRAGGMPLDNILEKERNKLLSTIEPKSTSKPKPSVPKSTENDKSYDKKDFTKSQIEQIQAGIEKLGPNGIREVLEVTNQRIEENMSDVTIDLCNCTHDQLTKLIKIIRHFSTNTKVNKPRRRRQAFKRPIDDTNTNTILPPILPPTTTIKSNQNITDATELNDSIYID